MDLTVFFRQQLKEWPLAANNYLDLLTVRNRELKCKGYTVHLQYNPGRILSSTAKVDEKSIQERPCFLCAENRPKEQGALPILEHYSLLVNPYPIFPMHFTIADNSHVEQLIKGRFEDMLSLAEQLDDFVIFYNGPRCGASAPDHFHFQAGKKGCLPEEKESIRVRDPLRNSIRFRGSKRKELINQFNLFYAKREALQRTEKEPMMNILVWFDKGSWTVILFPRTVHRPSQFYASGEEQILFSPGAVDFGGLVTLPREEDFWKIDCRLLENMFQQII